MPARSTETDIERRLRQVGDHPVAAPVVCVLTRFHLRSPRYLLPSYRNYRQVMQQAQQSETPGLLRAAFLVEGPSTWYSLSIWSDTGAIGRFGTNAPSHVDAANRIFERVRYDDDQEPEIWSTKWRLQSVSNNLNWDGFDLRGIVAGMGEGGGHADR